MSCLKEKKERACLACVIDYVWEDSEIIEVLSVCSLSHEILGRDNELLSLCSCLVKKQS